MLATYQKMLRVVDSYAPQMQRSLKMSLIASIIDGVIFALLFPLLNDCFQRPIPIGSISWILLLMFVLFAIETGLRWQELTFSWLTANDITYDTRMRLGEQLRRIPLEELSRRRSGDLNVVLNGNVSEIVLWLGTICTTIIQTAVVPLVTVFITVWIDWRLALLMAVSFPLAVPIYRRIRDVTAQSLRSTALADAETASRVIEYAQGLPVLRATRQIGAQSDRLRNAIRQQHQLQRQSNQLLTLPQIGLAAIVQLGLLLLLGAGVWLTRDRLALPHLFALLIIITRFSEPLSVFASFASVFDLVEVALDRIDTLLKIPPLQTLPQSQPIQQFDICFEDVSFTYAGDDRPTIRQLSCQFPESSFTALVGTSGSGKTTLTRLIMRYADVQQGKITIGGVDLRSLNATELMQYISVVFQDVYLFDDTILNNIRIACPTATDDEVITAAQAAYCHDFILRFPEGYHTKVGELGGAISGGERQRISIARAILKNAPIVLLDEPTSALDTESEQAVQQAINQLIQNKTVIVIAHRLSTIVAADQILVLELGQIIERGTHQALIERSSKYAAMWKAQHQLRQWRVSKSS
jgi:ATP-binding cassette, subfamily B, bacterial IrtB/YbtQ